MAHGDAPEAATGKAREDDDQSEAAGDEAREDEEPEPPAHWSKRAWRKERQPETGVAQLPPVGESAQQLKLPAASAASSQPESSAASSVSTSERKLPPTPSVDRRELPAVVPQPAVADSATAAQTPESEPAAPAKARRRPRLAGVWAWLNRPVFTKKKAAPAPASKASKPSLLSRLNEGMAKKRPEEKAAVEQSPTSVPVTTEVRADVGDDAATEPKPQQKLPAVAPQPQQENLPSAPPAEAAQPSLPPGPSQPADGAEATPKADEVEVKPEPAEPRSQAVDVSARQPEAKEAEADRKSALRRLWEKLNSPVGKKADEAEADAKEREAGVVEREADKAPAKAEVEASSEPKGQEPAASKERLLHRLWTKLNRPVGRKGEAEAAEQKTVEEPAAPASKAQVAEPIPQPSAEPAITEPVAEARAVVDEPQVGTTTVEQAGERKRRFWPFGGSDDKEEESEAPLVAGVIEAAAESDAADEVLSDEERARRAEERAKRKRERLRKQQAERTRKQRREERKRRRAEAKERRRQEREAKREAKARRKAEELLNAAAGNPVQRQPFDEKIPYFGPKLAAYRQRKRAEAEEKKKGKAKQKEGQPPLIKSLLAPYYRWRQDRARRLGRNIVGLHIGASHLRAVHLREGKPTIIAERRIPEGIIVHGLPEEPDELAAEIKELWRQGGLSSKKVNFSVANRLVTLRTIEMPAQEEEDIEQALAMNADQVIAPMNPDDSIIDYAELSRSGPHVSLQVAAADEEMLKTFVRAVEKAGLFPVSCELGPLAAGRALVIPRSPSEAHAIIDVGSETTSFLAASGPDIFFLRVLELGGSDFTEAIAQALGCSWAEAEKLKQRSGLGLEPADPSLDMETFARCRDAMRPVSDRLCQEIAQTRQFYENSPSGRPIIGYGLLGGGAKLVGLPEQIELFTGLTNRIELRPWPGLEQITHLDERATAVGLARGHTMSLMPDIEARSFALALPGQRRKSKISMDEAERTAKRLAARRKREPSTNPKMVGALLALMILGGGFYGAKWLDGYNKNQAENVQMAKRAAAAAERRAAAPIYEGIPNANQASKLGGLMVGSPNWQVVNEVAKKLSDDGVEINEIQATNSEVTFTGLLPADSTAGEIRLLAADVPGVSEATTQNRELIAGRQAFSLKVVVPMRAGGKGGDS